MLYVPLSHPAILNGVEKYDRLFTGSQLTLDKKKKY
jgi:hypothetical protein